MSGFEPRPARRENVPLLLGFAGGTGSGKTLSALMVAKGLAAGDRFVVIDTENGRSKMYADDFAFDHVELDTPFSPDRYTEALAATANRGYPVVVIDSASHEHAGEGGLLDLHEDELQRMAGDDYKRREAMTWAAWVKPKQSHKRFVGQLLRVPAHVILCLRAEEKIEIVREDGKVKVRPKVVATGADGWVPVAEKTLPYELTASFLLLATDPGMPKPIKLPDPLRPIVALDRRIDELVGRELGAWARGPAAGAGEAASVPEPGAPSAAGPTAELATEDERRGLFQRAEARGVPVERLREIVNAVAGTDETAEVPRALIPAILDQIDAESVPL